MRKITLLFLSMFLMVGTMVAQSTAFELTAVNPNSDNAETTVYNIRLEFTKDVVVTLPEGGIPVVNNDTKDTILIDRVHTDEWTPKNVAIFLFEKILVADDKGEEWRDQYIDIPGTYSVTIPAGCIKSVDDEAFAEQTFTFSIVSTFGVASFTPTQTDKLEKIDITFEKEITEVKMPEAGLMITDMYYSNFWYTKNEVTISEDKKTVTLELQEPITVPNWYDLIINQGVFVSADGINEYITLSINVFDSKPSFSTNYEDGDKVKELGNLEITFDNVKEVKLVEGAEAVTVYLPGGSEGTGTATLADGKITVTFEQAFTEEGDYTFVIPAGMFTMDGVPNEARELTVNLYSFEIIPLEIVNITPTAGPVEQLDKIVIKFNQVVQLSWTDDWMKQISQQIKLTCGEQEYILTNDAGYSTSANDELVYLVNAEWNGYEYTSTPITAAGTYTLNMADIVVDHAGEEVSDQWGTYIATWHSTKQSCMGTITWTIADDGSAIKATDAEAGEQAIYDLLGRRIEKITGTGIYIVNGKKVVVK